MNTRNRGGHRIVAVVAMLMALAPIPGKTASALERVIVAFAGRIPEAALAATGSRLVRPLMLAGYALVETPNAAALRAIPGVLHLERNLQLEVQASLPNDPCNNLVRDPRCPYTAWSLGATAAATAWERYPTQYFSPSNPKSMLPANRRPLVAVIDTPIMRGNPDFKNGYSSDDRVFGGQLDVAGIQGFPNHVQWEDGPHSYHGTYVAGLVAATANNSFGSAGLGYVADLLPLGAVHGGNGRAEAGVVGDAIIYAHQRGARVITLALGLTEPSSYVNAAIQQVVSSPNPPLVIAAAGNNTGDQPFYPAWFDNVMAIGGTDEADEKAPCANFGPKISVSAPARRVQGLSFDTTVTMIAPDCGTSAATPQVAGLAALLFSQDPARTPEQVRYIIEQTADDLGSPGRDNLFGYGRINADRALAWGLNLAAVDNASSTPGKTSGGRTTITATARGGEPVTAAEFFVGRAPTGADERGFTMSPADGAFDSYSEAVTATYPVSGMQPGGHRIYLRAKDATGIWGPVTTATIFADGFAPVIQDLQATDSVRVLDGGSAISFTMNDEHSKRLTFKVEARSMLDPSVAVWTHQETANAGEAGTRWEPGATTLSGRYTIKVTVRDEAGNASSATTSVLLL